MRVTLFTQPSQSMPSTRSSPVCICNDCIAPDLTWSMATDPVCGMRVDPAKPGATALHAGTTYYFCCAHCAARFRAAPETYLQPATDPVCGMQVEPANAAAEIEHAGRTYYFCSKHRSEEPTSELQSLAYLVCRLRLVRKTQL